MADVKNRKTLGIRWTDENLNSKTFSVGYINPDNSDAVNKILAQKIMAFSTGSIDQVYTTEIENITSASTDTSVTSFTLESTSDFLSMDNTTWTNFITSQSNYNSAYMNFAAKKGSIENYSSILSIPFLTLHVGTDINNSAEYANIINARLLPPTSNDPIFTISQTKSGVWKISTPGTYNGIDFSLQSSYAAAIAIINDIYDNIVQPSSGIQWTLTTIGGTTKLQYTNLV